MYAVFDAVILFYNVLNIALSRNPQKTLRNATVVLPNEEGSNVDS